MNSVSGQLNELLLDELVDEVCQQLQRGARVDIESLVQRHPEVGEQLRKLFPTLQAITALDQDPSKACDPDFTGEHRLIGDYRILQQIGRGGMGVVYEAEQLSMPRQVALKVLPLASLVDSRALQRFKNEVAAVATLEHPNIVPVYAVGEERGIHFYAMKLIRGQSLAAVIRELRARADREEKLSGDALQQAISEKVPSTFCAQHPEGHSGKRSLAPFPETIARGKSNTARRVGDTTYFRNVARLILQAAEALQHAHDQGIVHRDIKPGNLLLDSTGTLYVTDFGLARIETGPGVTMTGDLLGTLRYMSPEQIAGNRLTVDHRTDVYSLGATLYELLTLQPMWTSEDKAELIRQISIDEPTAPRRINPQIPLDLETIVLKATSKSPADRYHLAESLADDIRCFLDQKPILASRPTIPIRINRWARRNPAIMTSMSIVLFIVTIILSISNYLINKERAAKNLALGNAQRSERTARENSKFAQAIADFVRGDFLGLTSVDGQVRFADDFELLGKDSTLRDLLDRAALKLRQRSDLDPRINAELYWIIGVNYRGVGEFELSCEFLQRSLELRKQALGNGHWDTLNAMNSLAVSYHDSGNRDKALELYQQVYLIAREEFGVHDVLTLKCMTNLAGAYIDAGELDRARSFAERALKQAEITFGDDDRMTLNCMEKLASVYKQEGKLNEALPILESVFTALKTQLGSEHPDTIRCQSELASTYIDVGKFELAIDLFQEILDARLAILGHDHVGAAGAMNNLAYAYSEAGKLDLAIPIYLDTMKLREENLGLNHPDTLTTMNNLAESYRGAGQLDLAIPLIEMTVSRRKESLGADHPDTLGSLNNLALAYIDAGKPQLASPILEEILQHNKGRLDYGLPNMFDLTVMNNLAVCYAKMGKLPQAITQTEELLKDGKPLLGPDHPLMLLALTSLAAMYGEAGQLDNAIHFGEESLALYEKTFPLGHPETLFCMNNLAQSYQLAGKLDRALPLYSKAFAGIEQLEFNHAYAKSIVLNACSALDETGAVEESERIRRRWLESVGCSKGEESLEYAAASAFLAVNLLKQQKWSDAEVVIRDCLSIREVIQPDHWSTYNAMALLGSALFGQQELIEAEPLLISGYEGMRERVSQIPPKGKVHLAAALQRLIEFYEETDNASQLNKYRNQQQLQLNE